MNEDFKGMVESKADELKMQTMEAADKAESQIKGGVDAVEHSKAGQFIPTHFENIKFKTVIFGTICLSILATLPIYLMFSIERAKFRLFEFIQPFWRWIFLIFGLLTSIIDFVIVGMKLEKLSKLILLTKGIKVILLIISSMAITFISAYSKILFMLNIGGIIFLEFILVYYITLFFNRIHADNFDDEGNPKQKEVV